MTELPTALSGLKVIDCTQMISGAWCSMILADLGADVAKIDRPSGDLTRVRHGSFSFYDYLNRNKRSLALNLKLEEAALTLRQMAANADVFVENWRPGYLEKLGLGYEELAAINPRLIYCSISGFGHDGPYRELGGFDLVAQALSGIMSFNERFEGEPQPLPIPLSDLNAGTFGVIAILSALQHRERTGAGQKVEATLLETALAYAVSQTGLYLSNGEIAAPSGGRNRLGTPYEPLQAQDGFVIIAAASQSIFERACDALDIREIITDPDYATLPARLANRDGLRARLEAVLAKDTVANWVTKLSAYKVPAAPINDIGQALEDPQVQARGMVVEVGDRSYVRTPVTLHQSPVSVRRGAASAGQHGRAVLAEYGFDQEQIDRLFACGVALDENGPGSTDD